MKYVIVAVLAALFAATFPGRGAAAGSYPLTIKNESSYCLVVEVDNPHTMPLFEVRAKSERTVAVPFVPVAGENHFAVFVNRKCDAHPDARNHSVIIPHPKPGGTTIVVESRPNWEIAIRAL